MPTAVVALHVDFPSQGARVNDFLARSMDRRPWPGVVGLNQHIRDTARRLVREGLAVLAVDSYDERVTDDPAEAAQLKVTLDVDRAVRQLVDALPFLRSLPFVDERRGMVGVCMGGGLSLIAACGADVLHACALFYPSIFCDLEELEGIDWPIPFHVGTRDTVAPAS